MRNSFNGLPDRATDGSAKSIQGWHALSKAPDLKADGGLGDAGDLQLPPSAEARALMEDRLASRLVQVGIRCMSGQQLQQVRDYGVEVIDMRAWNAGVRPNIDGPVYVTVDLDGLDPAYAPGVSHREPGGLSVRD